MTLRLFGANKKKAKPGEAQDAGTASIPEAAGATVEFEETTPVPAAASPPESETVPAAVGSARALRAARSDASVSESPIQVGATRAASSPRVSRKAKPARKAPKAKRAKKASKLTKKQLAQRKYASRMRTVRKRAKSASGGKGRIAKRSGATKLRRQLGLKAGKPSKKGARKKR